jgi:hypothetical protein
MLVIGFGYKVGLLIEGIELSKGLREPKASRASPLPRLNRMEATVPAWSGRPAT